MSQEHQSFVWFALKSQAAGCGLVGTCPNGAAVRAIPDIGTSRRPCGAGLGAGRPG
jgi:hypothetical protein